MGLIALVIWAIYWRATKSVTEAVYTIPADQPQRRKREPEPALPIATPLTVSFMEEPTSTTSAKEDNARNSISEYEPMNHPQHMARTGVRHDTEGETRRRNLTATGTTSTPDRPRLSDRFSKILSENQRLVNEEASLGQAETSM